ncbi:MAG TPA: YceH family protein [Gaiellaceae bacterium]|nr:YceH family protein [Gaiellaceae bacterium]
MDADPVEIRVLGCLIEKQRTTPDVYPLSLNALRLACNQATNREPVVEYDEPTIRQALDGLERRRWARLASGQGSRAAKFRHLLGETLALDDRRLSLLAVLMLRGPQTEAELRQRSDRLYAFADADEVAATLAELSERELVQRIPPRPGQRGDRWEQLLGDGGSSDAAPSPASSSVEERLAALERQVAEILERLEADG